LQLNHWISQVDSN